MLIIDWISKWAEQTPQQTALISTSSQMRLTYAELDCYAEQLVEVLLNEGFKEGDRLVTIYPHGIEHIGLWVACQRLGVILVPLNYRLSSMELQHQLNDAQPKRVLLHPDFRVLASDFHENLLPLDCIAPNFERINNRQRNYVIDPDKPIFIFYTSGTTGEPKGVIYTNKMLFWNSLNTSMQLGITFKDITFNVLPPYHTSGWNVFVTPILHKGGTIVFAEKFNPEASLNALSLYKITLFMALPTMLSMIQKSNMFDSVDLSSLRFVISGGENVSQEIITKWWNQKNIFVRPGYGLTEAGPSISSLHHDLIMLKPNSIGKPNFYLELKLVNKKGEVCDINEVGEICIRGDVVTPGYWNKSHESFNKIKEGWLHTGDLAYKDQEGFLYLKGRLDDMYISGGENIFPQEVEMALLKVQGVKQAVVLKHFDEKWGDCGIAFITVFDLSINESTIRQALSNYLAKFKHPKSLFILDEMPLTGVGKISRKQLWSYFNQYLSINSNLTNEK
jgi:fatty-acyl-CoA synthase